MPRNLHMRLVVFCSILVVGLFQANARASSGSRSLANDPPAPGVRVLSVEKKSAAERAGLQKGDIILGWSRGEESGKIENPFDFSWVDIEQRPRGEMDLTGTRDAAKKSWILTDENWGIDTAPVYQGRLLQVYEHTQALLAAKKTLEAAKYWNSASAPLPESSWLPAWSADYSARLFRSAKDVPAADAAYQRATELSANLDVVAQARIADAWGHLDSDEGVYTNAIPHYREAIRLLQSQHKGTLLEALFLTALGGDLANASQLDEAQLVEASALEIRGRLAPDSFEMAKSLDAMGRLAMEFEESNKAADFCEQAWEIQRRIASENLDEAFTQTCLAWTNVAADRFAQAEKHDLRALEIYRKLAPESYNAASVLISLSIILKQRGDHAGSVKLARQAVEIAKSLHVSPFLFSVTLSQLALAEFHLGSTRQADKHFIAAARIFQTVHIDNDADYKIMLNNLGEFAVDAHKFHQAEHYLNAALALEGEESSLTKEETLMQLGYLYLASGNPARSEQMFLRALPLFAKLRPGSYDQATVLSSLAHIALLKHDRECAEKFYEQATSAIEVQTKKLGGSREIRADYRGNVASFYRDYMDVLIQRGKVSEAFDVSERFRAQTLLEVLSRATVDIHQESDPVLSERKHKLDAQIKASSERRMRLLTHEHQAAEIKAVDDSIADLSRELAEVEALLNSSSQNDARAQFHTLSAQEIQEQLLDKDTVLLEYELGSRQSYVFVVTPDSLTVHELPSRAKVESAARRMYTVMKAPRQLPGKGNVNARQEYEQAADLLSKMILTPVARDIRNKRLVIVADGALQYVPFAALPEPGSSRRPLQPLIVNHEIVSLPSASVLAVLRKQEQERAPAPKAVAVIADPVFRSDDPRVNAIQTSASSTHRGVVRGAEQIARTGTAKKNLLAPPSSFELLTRSAADIGLSRDGALKFSRLLYSRLEADEILKITPRGKGKEAVDFDASRAAAISPELSQYRIIHFATHGLLDSFHPEFSGLVFSMVDKKGRPQNGFLELQDIYNLKLPADLVVLSACETGLGKEVSGEGLVGLTRGFMYAGATRVVASLWRVSDVGTSELMGAFYKSMEKDGLPPAAALRAAQIKLWQKKQWNDPYYWAAFEIQGEWR